MRLTNIFTFGPMDQKLGDGKVLSLMHTHKCGDIPFSPEDMNIIFSDEQEGSNGFAYRGQAIQLNNL